MPISYPPVAPTLSGDVLTINRFLNSPTLIQRRLNTLAQQRFIADVILSGRYPASGGAVLYEQTEAIFPARTAEAVEPGAMFPVTTVGTGPAQIAAVKKWGLDSVVTDEAIRRQLFNPVDRALIKLVNGVVRQVDTVALAAINAAPIANFTVAAAWSTSTRIIKDIAQAVANVRAVNMGYDPDTLVVDDNTFVNLMGDTNIINAMRREDTGNAVYTGKFPMIEGLRVLTTPNLPTAGKAYVLDSTLAGGMAEEEPLSSKSIREEQNERWRLRAKRIVVPIVIEPGAICSLSGI